MSSRPNPTLKSTKPRVGITIGDPSGIGPSITALAVRDLCARAHFVVIGDKWVFEKLNQAQHMKDEITFIDLHNVSRKNFQFGKVRAEYGRASVEYLDRALELINRNEIDCLVTAPISKEALGKAGFSWSGHTEYLAARTHCRDLVMMLLNDRLKISLVTRHIPLVSVSKTVRPDTVRSTIITSYRALRELFLCRRPRIVVCGVNPHASDNGYIGSEEKRIVIPALRQLRGRGWQIDGPLSADVALGKAYEGYYDCVIAMYHDQALIPLKLSGNESGVNLTLGLPFVRTSPLHGTAFDIAGTHAARPDSMIAAIRLAIQCTSNQKKA